MSNSEYYQALKQIVIREYECLKAAGVLLDRQNCDVKRKESALDEARAMLEVLQEMYDACERSLKLAEDEAGQSAESILSEGK